MTDAPDETPVAIKMFIMFALIFAFVVGTVTISELWVGMKVPVRPDTPLEAKFKSERDMFNKRYGRNLPVE